MITTAWRRTTAWLFLATAAVFTGCADQTILDPIDSATELAASARRSMQESGVCDNLRVPAGHKMFLRVYANGVQIYRWSGTEWSFMGPSAVLTSDAYGNGTVGIHYGGPTWESLSGSKVVGAVRDRCTPDTNAISWLLLDAVATEGPGIFRHVSFIQRVNTSGGTAPSHAGSFPDQEARVPYTTEYLFYRAH
jgi:hypothetical protein